MGESTLPITTEERKEYNKRWREKNKEKMTRHRKAWYEENKNKPGYKEKLYESRIKFKYGIGVGVVNEMLYNQSNRCAICEK